MGKFVDFSDRFGYNGVKHFGRSFFMYIGYQLSSVTPYLQDVNSMREAFQKIAAIGYRDVQLQGASLDIPDEEIARALKKTA